MGDSHLYVPSQVSYRSIKPDVLDSAPHRALALAAAREAIVVLENVEHTLPLPTTRGLSVGVVGPCKPLPFAYKALHNKDTLHIKH